MPPVEEHLATFQLTRSQADVVFAHAIAGHPNEACGLFAGRAGRVDDVYALTNADASPISYLIDSQEQFATFREVEGCGLEIVGCFHSHVRSEAYPSRTDVERAYYPEWIYVIVSLRDEDPELRAFRIVDGEITELRVDIVG